MRYHKRALINSLHVTSSSENLSARPHLTLRNWTTFSLYMAKVPSSSSSARRSSLWSIIRSSTAHLSGSSSFISRPRTTVTFQ